MKGDRPLLVFVSDVHLTDALSAPLIPKRAVFERFWIRMEAARGKRPAILCFVGDLFDIVRSPRWFEGSARPYHTPNEDVVAVIDAIVEATLAREADFFEGIRLRAEQGALEVRYVLGKGGQIPGSSSSFRWITVAAER